MWPFGPLVCLSDSNSIHQFTVFYSQVTHSIHDFMFRMLVKRIIELFLL